MRSFLTRLIAHGGALARALAGNNGRATQAVAAIEFAITVPFLLLGLIGVIDLGIGVYRNMQVHEAAQVGAQYAVANGFNSANISAAVQNATAYSSISALPAPTQFCGCATSTGVTSMACGSSCPGGSTAGTYVSVSATATYYPNLLYSGLFPESFTLAAQSTVRIK